MSAERCRICGATTLLRCGAVCAVSFNYYLLTKTITARQTRSKDAEQWCGLCERLAAKVIGE